MPPSPAMRCSPGREPRADDHKRGHSLESGMLLKPRDDDLALFNEVQSRERDNFLLQSNDDFEDTFMSKLRHFQDYKLGINIPTRGESSDLLHAEEEKNDYEWLLTPPDTPLFPSLDDEASEVNLAQRGRPRTQPISISRSSTMEKSHRSSRGSASPNRFSPSPRSANSTFERQNRASPAPSPSPPTSLRPTSTTHRPSPSRKPATSVPRASTPTPRRSSMGSNGTTGPLTGPLKTSRGNSASPKVRAWQSSIPGFSTEVPPNLRTSLADRPASYVRGSSPASRSSRQSMSPTASRSISSSKGSVASSAEDEVESLRSVIVGSGSRSGSRRAGGFSSNKGLVSKKPSRTASSSSAPKRSFDLALRQMDHRNGPQNMFRPLLSGVPSSSFHVGITSSAPRTIISRNSSITTSSNASSGLVHDPEMSQDDATSGCVNVQECNIDCEVFMLENDENETCCELDASRNLVDHNTKNGSELSGMDSETGMLICSRCGCGYALIGPVENDLNLCVDCVKLYSRLTIVDPMVESREVVGKVKVRSGQHEDGQSTYGEPIWNFLSENSLSRSRSEECAPKQVSDDMVDFSNSKVDLLDQKIDSSNSKVDNSNSKIDPSNSNVNFSNSNTEFSNPNADFSGSKVDSLEGAGISILLKKSSSIKGSVVRNTNFSASSIMYDDFSYVRDSTNSVRSASVSSSVDFGPVKQTDTRFNRQLSTTKSEMENYKFDLGSSLSGTSSHVFHQSSLGTSTENDENNLQTVLNQTFEDASFQKVEDSGVDTCALQTCTFEEGTTPNLCADSADVVEVPLGSISEGEFDRDSKCDDSGSSKSSLDELRRESGVTIDLDKDVTVAIEDYDSSNHESNIIEESVVLVKPEKGLNRRSLTLEEATDTILFCSSIVHKLAYEAATIAIENENPPDQNDSWPLIPATRKPDLNKTEPQNRTTTKRSSKSQNSRHKKAAEPDTTKPPNRPETEGKTDQPKTRIVGSNNFESKKPPLLESKCNCTIM